MQKQLNEINFMTWTLQLFEWSQVYEGVRCNVCDGVGTTKYVTTWESLFANMLNSFGGRYRPALKPRTCMFHMAYILVDSNREWSQSRHERSRTKLGPMVWCARIVIIKEITQYTMQEVEILTLLTKTWGSWVLRNDQQRLLLDRW